MPAKTKFEVKLGPATREAFGRTLLELGRENKDIVVCDADLSKSTMTTYFAKEFPGRFFSCGIAEANMVGIGAGLARAGKIPFVSSFSAFVMNKGFEQLRLCAAYPKANLKVVVVANSVGGQKEASDYLAMIDNVVKRVSATLAEAGK
jgi:transketolase